MFRLPLRRENSNGQLGTGDWEDKAAPYPVAGRHSRFAAVSAGYSHTCGVLASSQRIACFGEEPVLARV